MSQALKANIKQCCVSDPVWIFTYSDGSYFLICNNDFKSPGYRVGVTEIINMETQQVFTPDILFGGKFFAKV
jgi:hypothetical protein